MPAKIKVAIAERTVTFEFPTENDAQKAYDKFLVEVAGQERGDWTSLADAAATLGVTRNYLYEQIVKAENFRAGNRKSEWKLGIHYRRRIGGKHWEASPTAIQELK